MTKLRLYPPGAVRALLTTDHVSPATRSALTKRLNESSQPYSPAFFTEPEFILLRAICTRLTGGDDLAATVDVARSIDRRLAAGDGNGWRHADFPDDRIAWRLGLIGINDEAQIQFARPFVGLSSDEQDATLHAIQSGET